MDHNHNHNPSHVLAVYLDDDEEIRIPLDRPDGLTADMAEDYARRIKGDTGIWGATEDGYVIVPARSIRYMELTEVPKDEGDCQDAPDAEAEADLTTLSGGHAGEPEPHVTTHPPTQVPASSVA
jgi:hypothetical protein